jgi:hypothetical protein
MRCIDNRLWRRAGVVIVQAQPSNSGAAHTVALMDAPSREAPARPALVPDVRPRQGPLRPDSPARCAWPCWARIDSR